ncbi:DnaB-like helicase N-terminal domain-containing protein, partial [Bacillus altitudinis]|uniref:DnaB-like helicase N-terminal domain-containing protein n=1 Tax=Bacillus altitudinis TaxID=293387 RepID=UPI003B52D192
MQPHHPLLPPLFLQPSPLTLPSQVLIPHHFYTISHQKIYNAILLLRHTPQPLDLLTLTSQLPNTHLLQHLRPISYLT